MILCRLGESVQKIWDKKEYQWNKNFQEAEIYFLTHGDLNIPPEYRTKDGKNLGAWITNQRQIYAGTKKGAVPLTELQIEKLNNIGMIWKKRVVVQCSKK